MAEQVVLVGSGWTNQVKATGSGELIVTGSVIIPSTISTLENQRNALILGNEILVELKILNEQMEILTEEKIIQNDVKFK